MLSIGLRRWYINITITILDIIHRSLFYVKHNVSETGLYLSFQVEPTQFGPLDRARAENTAVGIRHADHVASSIRRS
jgi:hypothetical protein